MEFNIITSNEICYQFIQESNRALLYYSHIPISLIALFVSVYIFFKSGKVLSSRLLLMVMVLFSLWSAFDLVTWISYDTRLTMFAWMPLGFLYMLVFAFSLHFAYVFLDKKDISLTKKLAIFLPILPVILLTPTNFNLTGFNNEGCEAIEGVWFTNYYHLFGAFILLWILALAVSRYRVASLHSERKQVVLLAIGIEFFLVSFFAAGYISSLTDNFNVLIYGLFGMPVFMAFLGYLIVKFKAFEIKLLGTQSLVMILIFLISAQFFYVKTRTNFILTTVTFLLVIVTGIFLVRSFKRSEERKEELQIMADRLAISNDRLRELDNTKTEFISIASHQLRTPLTSIKGYCALILEGSYGTVNPRTEEVLRRIVFSNDRLVNLVENLLNVSRMEAGRIEYAFEDHRIEDILTELCGSFSFAAKSKHLTLTLNLPKTPLPSLKLDKQKIQEVFSNLIDNALKYTDEGGVVITADQSPDNNAIRVTVKDSGIGIPKEEIPLLFTKFSRGRDVNRLHANGTGLGLYVAKNIVEAHRGTIHIESKGDGKGTSFVVTLG